MCVQGHQWKSALNKNTCFYKSFGRAQTHAGFFFRSKAAKLIFNWNVYDSQSVFFAQQYIVFCIYCQGN